MTTASDGEHAREAQIAARLDEPHVPPEEGELYTLECPAAGQGRGRRRRRCRAVPAGRARGRVRLRQLRRPRGPAAARRPRRQLRWDRYDLDVLGFAEFRGGGTDASADLRSWWSDIADRGR